MAIIRGGDIRQLTLDGREFDVAPEANVNLDLGGRINETELNGNQTYTVPNDQKWRVLRICPFRLILPGKIKSFCKNDKLPALRLTSR